MTNEQAEYADLVTITYAPAIEYGNATDPDEWVEVEIGGGEEWSVGWLDRIADESVWPLGVTYVRRTNVTHVSWGADGAAIAITVAIAKEAFDVVVGMAVARLLSALAEKVRPAAVPVDLDVAVDRARQRVATHYEVSADELRLVQTTDGTDGIAVVFEHGDGSVRYEVEIGLTTPTAQTVRCKRVYVG
ncbi:MAG: hypothetical protein HHJ13_00055 [Phycicoccus sp.]|nr:hypothetical protein [Phycicoccus sp.]